MSIAEPELQTKEQFKERFLESLRLDRAVDLERAGVRDAYCALVNTVRDHLMQDWLATTQRRGQGTGADKTVVYLSAEYLLGRQLENALLASGLTEVAREALADLGLDLDEVSEQEVEPGLGNGGLGRLAACFADSLATLGRPAIGYGICYEYGIFEQAFEDGRQVERPDQWLDYDNPWLFSQREHAVRVGFGGTVEADPVSGRRTWHPAERVMGVPHNLLVPGYRNHVVNTLRLWKARGSAQFNLEVFNAGDYIEAVRQQAMSENISRVLYPEDSTPAGKELRLRQQYFFTACALADLIRIADAEGFDLATIPDRVAVQLNDTHPVIAIPELMRILIDERGMDYDTAWDITSRCFAYTCHTLLPEALEVWPTSLLERLLPRHLEIIYRINDDFLAQLRKEYPGDEVRVRRMSIVAEHPERSVRMAYLATVAGSKVNGVAELHSQLLRETVLHDFAEMWPERFTNVTNGVTPRRFVKLANPRLSDLITEVVGDGWLNDLDQLSGLESVAEDASFQERWAAIKHANKVELSQTLERRGGRPMDTEAIVDVMIKRLHEYKRQSLKLLHVCTLYKRLRENPGLDVPPRVVLFGAKAAPGLPARQADHPPDQPGGRPHRRRPGHARAAVGGVPGQLQRDPGRADRPGGEHLRADLAGRQGGVGHRQHEAGPQWRPHRRHARRGQRGDPRARRRRELLPVRPHRAGGHRAQDRRLRPRSGVRRRPRAAWCHRGDRRRLLLPARGGRPVPAGRGEPAHARRIPGARRLSLLPGRAGPGRSDVGRPGGLERRLDPQHRPLRLLQLRPLDARLLRAHLALTHAGRARRDQHHTLVEPVETRQPSHPKTLAVKGSARSDLPLSHANT